MKKFNFIFRFCYKHFKRDPNIEKFIDFNYKKLQNNKLNNGIALFEIGYFHPIFIVYHYLSRICNEESLLEVAYSPDNSVGLKSRFLQKCIGKISIDNGTTYPHRILKSLGIKKFVIAPRINISNIVFNELKKILTTKDKTQLLKMSYRGIRVGDLFYDWHLRRTGNATIDFSDKKLYQDFRIFCSNLQFWIRYFDFNEVKYVFVSHAVYVQGLMARIGLMRGAKVFVVGDGRFNQLSLDNYFQDSEHKYYSPSVKKQFDYEVDRSRAASAFLELQTGSHEIDDAHRLVNGFDGQDLTRIISTESNVRVLIAAHCFSDAPHVFGDMHAVEFWEWLNIIGEASIKNSKYEWYVKPHPGFFQSDQELFLRYISKNQQIKVIPSGFSNLELFRQGINVVLTVHGTITFEAALFDKLVVNYSPVSPHMNYSFVKKPTSLEDFLKILDNLEDLVKNNQIDHSEVLHFYDLHHLRREHSWLYKQYRSAMLNYAGGYGAHLTDSKTLDYWVSKFAIEPRSEISMDILKKFIRSKEYLIPFQEKFSS